MAREATADVCAVDGCGNPAARSLSANRVKQALPELKLGTTGRRAHLCRQHYREFRKKTKEDRELERASW